MSFCTCHENWKNNKPFSFLKKIKETNDKNNCWLEYRERRLILGLESGAAMREINFSKKMKAEKPYDPVTPLLDTYPEISQCRNTHTTLFLALFATTEICNLDAPHQMNG